MKVKPVAKDNKPLIPNEETIEAMKAARRGDVIKMKDRDELFKQLKVHKTVVSDRDFEAILEAIKDPPDPPEELKELMRKHKEIFEDKDKKWPPFSSHWRRPE